MLRGETSEARLELSRASRSDETHADSRRVRLVVVRASHPSTVNRPRYVPAIEATVKRVLSGDRAWAAGVAAGAALVYATTFSPHVAAGDAPESVAGIRALGILHAPGYPAYVLVGRIFLALVPFGGAAARVNLFSLVCAALAVACVFVGARRLGAQPAAAAIGALALATGTSFWFYATFAKHYAFSALVLAGALVLVLGWDARGSRWRVAAAGGLLGLGAGASWQLAALAAPALACLVLFGARRPKVVDVAAPVAAGLLVIAGLGVFLSARARANPPINWGNPTSAARIGDLVTMKDFGFGPTTINRAPGAKGKRVGGQQVVALLPRIRAYTVVATRELGYLAVLVALYGAVAAVWVFGRVRAIAIAVHFVVNLVSAALVVGFRDVRGFGTGLAQGGFLIGVFLALALWIAAAVTDMMDRVGQRGGGRTKAQRTQRAANSGRDRAIAAGMAAVVLVGPGLLVHWRQGSHRQPPLVDTYVRDVFAALPAKAVILCWGAERAFPLLYGQVVERDRPDVVVIAADQIGLAWYDEELKQRYGITVAANPTDTPRQAAGRLGDQLRAERAVYLDAASMPSLINDIAYRPAGIVGEVVDGKGVFPPASMTALERRVATYSSRAVSGDPTLNRFPNELIFQAYEIAELELATALYRQGDLAATETHLKAALRLNPRDTGTAANLAKIQAQRQRAP